MQAQPGGAAAFRRGEAYIALKEKIPEIDTLLLETGALIAGGSILRTFNMGETDWGSGTDIDIYVPCKNLPAFLTVIRTKYDNRRNIKASEYCSSFLRRNGIRTVQSFRPIGARGSEGIKLDIMAVRNRTTPLNVVQNFDLTVCQIWYDGREVYATHPEDIRTKKATLQGDYVTVFTLGNRFLQDRIRKYNMRGFEIRIGQTVVPPSQYWNMRDVKPKSCTTLKELEETSKGIAWARKYLFRATIGTAVDYLCQNYQWEEEEPDYKLEEGYDSEDYVENPRKILDIKPAAYINQKGYEFLDYMEQDNDNNEENDNQDDNNEENDNQDDEDNMEGGNYRRKQRGGYYEVQQKHNPRWEEDFLNPYKAELKALVGDRGQTVDEEAPNTSAPWGGFTKKDVEFMDVLFSESTNARSLGRINPDEILYSMCPVCLKYISHETGSCMYMTHNCADTTGYFNKKLYDRYKFRKTDAWGRRTDNYVICWCTICGRICGNHQHYKVALHTEKAKLANRDGDPYETDCRRTSGGGGPPEKMVRFNALRAKALELNKRIGELSTHAAMNQLVEALWDGPLTTTASNKERMTAEKKFLAETAAFPNNVVRAPENYPDIAYPNAGDAELLPIVHAEATDDIKNHYDVDDESIVQFRHRLPDGTVNMHAGAGEQIAKSMLFNYVSSTMDQQDSQKFGMCWQYPTCKARLYPQELLAVLDQVEEKDPAEQRIYEQYKTAFNAKFAAAQRGGSDSSHSRRRHVKNAKKTRRRRTHYRATRKN